MCASRHGMQIYLLHLTFAGHSVDAAEGTFDDAKGIVPDFSAWVSVLKEKKKSLIEKAIQGVHAGTRVVVDLPGVDQRFGQGFLERLAAEILADDLALPIQEEGHRDAIDAVFGGELVLPTFTVKILHPRDLVGFQKAFELLLVLVKANTDDFKAVAVMLVVSLNDIGQFGYTRDAPGCPEIN